MNAATGARTAPGPSPRVRGSPVLATFPGRHARVHPPRVRGSRVAGFQRDDGGGSIPACAGKPCRRSGPTRTPRVHPRVCGEARRRPTAGSLSRGPSPRVRGSRNLDLYGENIYGSIPACAGKPARVSGFSRSPRVHPRVCGGSRAASADLAQPAGSIPACAGKPRRCRMPCSA